MNHRTLYLCRYCGHRIAKIDGWSGWYSTSGPTEGHLGSRGVCLGRDSQGYHEPEREGE